nr:PREDICTED: uncharacterized protein LOC107079426 isoform X1 [Lepisosteus oculatus]
MDDSVKFSKDFYEEVDKNADAYENKLDEICQKYSQLEDDEVVCFSSMTCCSSKGIKPWDGAPLSAKSREWSPGAAQEVWKDWPEVKEELQNGSVLPLETENILGEGRSSAQDMSSYEDIEGASTQGSLRRDMTDENGESSSLSSSHANGSREDAELQSSTSDSAMINLYSQLMSRMSSAFHRKHTAEAAFSVVKSYRKRLWNANRSMLDTTFSFNRKEKSKKDSKNKSSNSKLVRFSKSSQCAVQSSPEQSDVRSNRTFIISASANHTRQSLTVGRKSPLSKPRQELQMSPAAKSVKGKQSESQTTSFLVYFPRANSATYWKDCMSKYMDVMRPGTFHQRSLSSEQNRISCPPPLHPAVFSPKKPAISASSSDSPKMDSNVSMNQIQKRGFKKAMKSKVSSSEMVFYPRSSHPARLLNEESISDCNSLEQSDVRPFSTTYIVSSNASYSRRPLFLGEKSPLSKQSVIPLRSPHSIQEGVASVQPQLPRTLVSEKHSVVTSIGCSLPKSEDYSTVTPKQKYRYERAVKTDNGSSELVGSFRSSRPSLPLNTKSASDCSSPEQSDMRSRTFIISADATHTKQSLTVGRKSPLSKPRQELQMSPVKCKQGDSQTMAFFIRSPETNAVTCLGDSVCEHVMEAGAFHQRSLSSEKQNGSDSPKLKGYSPLNPIEKLRSKKAMRRNNSSSELLGPSRTSHPVNAESIFDFEQPDTRDSSRAYIFSSNASQSRRQLLEGEKGHYIKELRRPEEISFLTPVRNKNGGGTKPVTYYKAPMVDFKDHCSDGVHKGEFLPRSPASQQGISSSKPPLNAFSVGKQSLFSTEGYLVKKISEANQIPKRCHSSSSVFQQSNRPDIEPEFEDLYQRMVLGKSGTSFCTEGNRVRENTSPASIHNARVGKRMGEFEDHTYPEAKRFQGLSDTINHEGSRSNGGMSPISRSSYSMLQQYKQN